MQRTLIPRAWDRMGLTGRLSILMAGAMLIGAVVLLFTSVMHEKRHASEGLNEQLDDDMSLLQITLPEQAVIGDYATIEKMLDANVKSIHIEGIIYTDSFGKSISAIDNPVASIAPHWFASLIDMPAFSKKEPIIIGARKYGTVELHLTTTPSVNHMWSTFVGNVQVLLLALVLAVTITSLFVRYSLRPLFVLAEGAFRIGSGNYSVRIPEQGPAEMTVTISAFNQMAEQLKQTIDQLNQSRDKFSVLYNDTPVMLHSIDRTGTLIEVNDYWLKTMGYERGEVIGRPVTDFYAEASRKYAREVVQPAFFRDGVVKDISYQFVKKNGDLVDVLLSATCERDANGNVVRSLAVIEDITERKKTEEALKENEGQFRALVEQSLTGIAVIQNGTFVYVNPRLAEIIGYQPQEIIGKSPLDMVSDVDREKVRESLFKRMSGEIVSDQFNLGILRKDGMERQVALFSRAITYKGGRAFLSTLLDITDSNRAEEALRASERRYKAIVEDQAEFVVRYLPGGIVTFVNDTLCRYLNRKRDDLLGKSYYPFMHEEDRESFIRQIESLDSLTTSLIAEARVVLPDGRVVWHKWAHSAIFDTDGNIIEYQATGRDITDSKRAEEALRRSEETLQKIMDSSSAVIFAKDLDGKYIFINTLYEKLFHVSKSGIIGKTDYDIFPRDAADAFRDADLQALKARMPIEAEEAVPHDDGMHYYISLKFPLYDSNKKPYAVCGIATDITERKKMEEQSLRVQKLEAVGTLAGGIAHDFNNLLQGVFGYISLAKLKRDDREKSLAAIEEAEKALHLTVKLTNQLLTFSKGGKPVKKPIDLPPVIENAAKFALSGSRSNYSVAADESLWQVEADEGQIGQVIQNIVLNADQAMPEGGQVEITARNVQSSGKDLLPGLEKGLYVEIAIKDSGIGIPEHYLTKIFDPYFTTKEKGSGLGLATSYSIIKNHNGLIDVKSEMGKGTTFVIFLPATAAVRTAVQVKPAATAGRAGRVLVMDDEQVIRDVAGEMIRDLGHHVELAVHGKEAIEKYLAAKRSGDPFDVVILDLTIRAGMGGAETVRKLSEIDPGVKAVVSSGYSDDAVTSNYREQGFAAFLKKPYTVDELQEVLDTLLNS